MAHENTVTVRRGGKFFNMTDKGKQVGGPFNTHTKAVQAAKERSRTFGNIRAGKLKPRKKPRRKQ